MAALTLAILAGCGLRTAPQPIGNRIQPPQGVRVWTRDTQVLVGWQTLSDPLIRRWEGVQSYRIGIARLPLGCADCKPLEERQLALAPEAKSISHDGGMTVYQFTPTGPPATWVVRVGVRFARGPSPDSPPAFVDAVGSIPGEELRWERVAASVLGTGGKPGIRLYWNTRRERIVHIVTPTGGQEDRDLMFRVNLYRRVPPQPWPPLPVNASPIEGQFWIGPEPFVLNDPDASAVEYAMRLVDQQGNEGPASEPVSIPILKGPGK